MKKKLNNIFADLLTSEAPEPSALSLAATAPLSVVSDKHHLLIISDSEESLTRLKAALMADDTEITCATSAEDMCLGCSGRQDLVVVDVSPKQVGKVLKTIRNCAGCANVPVLVEVRRISAAPDLAGLLPTYRAMPCGYPDLIALARRCLSPRPTEHYTLGIL